MATSARRSVFVTVGTTKFEDLIRAVDTREFADTLAAKGYTDLIIQKGAGAYEPKQLLRGASGRTATLPNGLRVEYFDFAPALGDIIASAALVISHAGSGSIFETLTAGKALVVVPNPLLMDNHQAELGEHLAAQGVVACAAPEELVEAVRRLDVSALRPYARGSAAGMVAVIDALMGVA